MPLLLAHTARQTILVGVGEAAFKWRIRACLRQGGLSRNKVSVRPADGSPPKKTRSGDFGPPFPLFLSSRRFTFYTSLAELLYYHSWKYGLDCLMANLHSI